MRKAEYQDMPYLKAVSTHALMKYGFPWSTNDLMVLIRDEGRYLIAHKTMRPYVFYTHYSAKTDAYLVEAYKRHTSRALPSGIVNKTKKEGGQVSA